MVTNLLVSYCATCVRLRNVLMEAPWSSFDLIAGSLIWWVGAYSLYEPAALLAGPQKIVAALGTPFVASVAFALFGLASWISVCWPSRPPFWLRLLARAGTAYCLILLMAEDYARDPPPLSIATHATLVVSSAWGVMRTRATGG